MVKGIRTRPVYCRNKVRVKTILPPLVAVIALLSGCSPNKPAQENWSLNSFDFTPIQQGNVWVFQDTSNKVDYCSTPHNYFKTITVTKVWQGTGDTTMFTLSIHDSGFFYNGGSFFDSSTNLDTSYVETGKKTGDTLLLVGDNYNEAVNPRTSVSFYFPLSQKDASEWEGYTTFSSFNGSEVCHAYVPFAVIDDFVLVENIGLIYRNAYYINNTLNCGYESQARLISFNGKPPPQIPLSGK